MDTTHDSATRPIVICGFWRRVGALFIDLLLLGLVGMLVGLIVFDALARMGSWARLIGFAVALVYFGILNSRLGGGQTLGKRLLGIRVVDKQGRLLSLPRALLRYVVLGVPFFANNLPLSINALASIWAYVLTLVVFGGIFSIIYLYVFNRRTRQSLHDLVVGSYVEQIQRNSETEPKPLQTVWVGHVVVVVLVAATTLAGPVVGRHLLKARLFAGIVSSYRVLSTAPHVMHAQVSRRVSISNGTSMHSIDASLRLDLPHTDDKSLAESYARVLAQRDPDIAREDRVVIVLRYGYDMGIASSWRVHSYQFKPDELK